MGRIVFKAKVKTATSGREYISVPKTVKKEHFFGEHRSSNTSIFEEILKRELTIAIGKTKMIYLDSLPHKVSISGDFMKTVVVEI